MINTNLKIKNPTEFHNQVGFQEKKLFTKYAFYIL